MLALAGNALVAADVNFNLVIRLRKNLMEKLDLEKLSAGASRMRAIEGALPIRLRVAMR